MENVDPYQSGSSGNSMHLGKFLSCIPEIIVVHMKNLISILIGLAMIGYLIFVAIQVWNALSGNISWGEISTHLIVAGVLLALRYDLCTPAVL